MNKWIMAVAGLVLGACVTAQAGYRTEAVVTAGTEAHQYVVQFKIIDKEQGTEKLSTAQSVTLKK